MPEWKEPDENDDDGSAGVSPSDVEDIVQVVSSMEHHLTKMDTQTWMAYTLMQQEAAGVQFPLGIVKKAHALLEAFLSKEAE